MVVCFFKQKTAYEMRISDWSSDVCSSDRKALAAGRRMGMRNSDEQAWTWLAINPAKALGVAERTGSLKPGKMADAVLWKGNPFSAYTRLEKVWIDGALMFDARDRKRRTVSDFEQGQPGDGGVT